MFFFFHQNYDYLMVCKDLVEVVRKPKILDAFPSAPH